MKNITLYILLFALCSLLLFVACRSGEHTDEWLNNGSVYLCPNCRGGYYVDEVGECENCNGMTSSCAFKYCYDCAREMNVCQYCGVERYFYSR